MTKTSATFQNWRLSIKDPKILSVKGGNYWNDANFGKLAPVLDTRARYYAGLLDAKCQGGNLDSVRVGGVPEPSSQIDFSPKFGSTLSRQSQNSLRP